MSQFRHIAKTIVIEQEVCECIELLNPSKRRQLRIGKVQSRDIVEVTGHLVNRLNVVQIDSQSAGVGLLLALNDVGQLHRCYRCAGRSTRKEIVAVITGGRGFKVLHIYMIMLTSFVTRRLSQMRIRIQSSLQTTFNPTHIDVINDSHKHSKGPDSHFRVVVVSPAFEGKAMITRHREVQGSLQSLFNEGLHSVSITTKTPEEWAVNNRVTGTPGCPKTNHR